MEFRQNHIRIVLWTVVTLLSYDVICIQYTPIDLEDYPDCAVLVTTPHEFSAHSSLQSDLDGAVNCITYDAINQAYLDAMKRIDFSADATPFEDIPQPPAVADIALVLLDVTRHLAEQYHLKDEDIELGLLHVDTMKTAIKAVCPAYLSSISCHAGKYRRHDGLCTNVEHPSWGAVNTVFTRLIPPAFADGISAPRVSLSGQALPPARIVSRTIHPDEGFHDHAGTTMLIAWGQFIDHDFTLMGMPVGPINRNEVENCCDTPPPLRNPFCFEIEVPEDDYFYHKFNIRCQDFVRSFPGLRPDCKLGSRVPFNTLTATIDANTVYGVSPVVARQLRTGHGGLLRMNPAFTQYDLKDLLPMKVDIPDEGCVRTNISQFCFLAGEIRVNEQLILACIHTLMAREHNRVAGELFAMNPHWEDEIVYEEARRIVIAEIQHITFHEFLPILLGKDTMQKHGLLLNPKGFWDGYDPETNPGILDAFAAAAYRFGHSLLPSTIERWSKGHKFIASRRLSNLIRRPYDLYRAGVFDEYVLGLTNQVAQAMDDSVTQEVSNNLFKKAGNQFGSDLIAFNIQRGREFGLPGYMFYREHCGLRTSQTFDEMIGTMPNSTIHRYSTIYETPLDIDLWSGGAAEFPMHGSLVGPTFACIIAKQFKIARQGDRFWYELPNQPSSFTEEQLLEIKKVKLSRVLCDNTDLIENIQIYPMVLPDPEINPRVPCKSSILPSLDLSHWREDAPTAEHLHSDHTQNRTNYVKMDTPVAAATLVTTASASNQSSGVQPSAYEYHIKTVAIIEGSNPIIDLNDILNPSPGAEIKLPLENHDNDHLRPRRSVNVNSSVTASTSAKNTSAVKFVNTNADNDYMVSNPSNRVNNVTSSSASNDTSSSSSSSFTVSKDVTKRSFYPTAGGPQSEMTQAIMEGNHGVSDDYHPSYHRRVSGHFGGNVAAVSSDDEGHDIEDFFRKNVPIYDGVPIARRHGYNRPLSSSSSSFITPPKKYYHFSPSAGQDAGEEEEEEEGREHDGKPMKGLLEVHADPDMEHEYVPMKIDEFGKQIVMHDEIGAAEDEESHDDGSSPSFPFHSSKYHAGGGSSYSNDDSGFYGGKSAIPSSHPYPFENSYSSPFKSSPHYHHHSDYSSSPYSSDGSPPVKYGTSHQYNSLADQQPRYYKHFKPSIPYPAHDDDDHFAPAPPSPTSSYSPYYSSSGHHRPTSSVYPSRSASYFNNHDFVPKRAPQSSTGGGRGGGGIRGSYASEYPTRSTHVPQTLEEYHRIHGTFDTSRKKANRAKPYRSRPIVVPQDDNANKEEEEEEEEKDKDTADYTRGPKSFVSLNFGTTGTSVGPGAADDSDDEGGVSIRHEIGHHHFKPKTHPPYFRPASTAVDEDTREYHVEYPAESTATKYRNDHDDDSSAGSIKAFVDSMFKQNNADEYHRHRGSSADDEDDDSPAAGLGDIIVGKKSNLVSPYNPHFGERVKQKTASPSQNILWHRKSSSDGRVARDKQSRDKNDRLLHEENIKMYDSLVKEVTMKPAKRDVDVDDTSRGSENEDDEKSIAASAPQPQETQSKQDAAEDEDDEEPQFKFWSHSTSEPN